MRFFELKINQNAFCSRGFTPDFTGGAYNAPPDTLAAGERGLTASLPKTPPHALGPVGLEFSALGLKEVVHPCARQTKRL